MMFISPSKTLFPLPGAFIAQSIIILYEDDTTVINDISKEHLYCLAQPLVSSHNVDKTDTNILESNHFLIDEKYDHVNHMHLVHYHHLYMNEIQIFFIASWIN